MAYQNIFSQNTTATATGFAGATVRVVITAGALTIPAGVGKTRVSLQAFTNDSTVVEAYIGHQVTSAPFYNFQAAPVQMRFAGAAGTTITAGSTVVSDDIIFGWDQTSNIEISLYLNASPASSAAFSTLTGPASFFIDAVQDASTQNGVGGYSVQSDTIYFVSKIESDSLVNLIVLGDRVLDAGLAVLDTECNKIYVCSQMPTSYTDATSTSALGNKNWGAGNAFPADAAKSGGGRQITSNAIIDGNITANGTVAAWAAVDTVNTRLLASGSLNNGKVVTNGQIFTLDAFTVGIPNH